MLKAVIVDDEPDAIESIKLILNDHFSDIVITGTAQSVKQAISIINTHKPDVVFLDIEMPNGNGFDVLEGLTNKDFHVIFITAYNQYALKAFKYSAVDYILKPVDIDELVNAIKRINDSTQPKEVNGKKMDNLLENMRKERPEKIALSTSEGIEFAKISDIIQVQAEGSYSIIKMLDQSELVVSKNLGEFEQLLEDHAFYRPHQSHLINVSHVKKITRLGNEIVMDDGSIAFLSRRKKNQFLDLMSTLVQKKK